VLKNQLTKNSYPDSESMSLVGSKREQTQSSNGGNSRGLNSFETANLGTKKERMLTPDTDPKPTTPKGNRTPVTWMRTMYPRPLDDGGIYLKIAALGFEPRTLGL
jgi:hypothetical protein